MRYRLGLDIGTNSIGWSVLELNAENEPCAVETAGARIFSDGRDNKSKATLAADRRGARSARRRRDRFKQRQVFLLDALTRAGLFPEDKAERETLRILNPLDLRARALTEKLEPWHIGRALFHLNQRRGFKSNRKDRGEETTSGKISDSARMLLEEMGLIDPRLPPEEYKALSKEDKKLARRKEAEARKQALEKLSARQDLSYGSFLCERHKRKAPTRARPGAGNDGKLYDVYPTRELYEDEFNKIWMAQAEYHPGLMTDAVRKLIHRVIFTQRPLKPQKRGRCTYLPEEERTFRAMPGFQRYRIYQEVNALEWITAEGKQLLRNHPEARNAVIDLLEKPTTRSGQVLFNKMKIVLKKMGLAEGNFEFNFETPKRKGFDGNLTSNVMQDEDYVGAVWHKWSLEKQDEFIDIILNGTPEQQARDVGEAEHKKGVHKKTITDNAQDDREIAEYLQDKYGLSEFAAENCINAPLQDATANVSLKAARLMLDKMRDGIVDAITGEISWPVQSDAAEAVSNEAPEFASPMRKRKAGEDGFEPMDELPYYGKVFQDGSHIIPGDRLEKDKNDDRKFYGGVTNPTVHIALNQIRQIVNELIKRYGHPYSIAIELGRDLPVGAEGRRSIEQEQKKNQDENARLDGILREHGQQTNRDNRLRLRLWEELDKDPGGRCCPFSGIKIGYADLFNGNAQIEHLIPFSKSLDDSRANKIICSRQANQDKGQQTPYQAFGDSPPEYDWHDILERAQRLPKPKQWRFQEDAWEIWNRDHDDFTSRHLNDTRYIGRLTREYLECICHIDKIDVLTGRLTALLRGHWGLNSVLSDGKLSENARPVKNRDDHRHHAVDAVVIGMTTRSILQKVATAANEAEELLLERLFPKDESGRSPIDPWQGFRDDVINVVRNIIVSHKTRRKKLRPGTTDGQLHNETAFGLVSGPDKKGEYETVVRRPIDYFREPKHVEAIRDPRLRQEFRQAFDRAVADNKKGNEGMQALARRRGIRNLRCFGPRQVIPVRDKDGKIYKGYQGDSNWAMEIYAFPENHKDANKWKGVAVSRFDANQPGFQPGLTHRPHPAARLVMRLQINDCIEIEQKGGKQIMRLQKMGQNGVLTFAPVNEANVDQRNRDKEDAFAYFQKQANTLKPLNPRKVHVSPTGLVSYEKRYES